MEFNVKEKVKDYYGSIAKEVMEKKGGSCGCNSSCCSDISNTSVIYDLEHLVDLPEAALTASLGCANPLVLAELKEGEKVLDLGSGGGIDVLMASKYVGESGKVYGLDMTDEMLRLANHNKEKMGVKNVEFLKGYIEEIPLPDDSIDIIISNCVINLVEDKGKALKEVARVLRPGGRIAIADIVQIKDVPMEIKTMAESWVGCIAGTIKIDEYEKVLKEVGFKEIKIEPIHVYTEALIKDIISSKQFKQDIDINWDRLDSAFAGANIKAIK